MDVHEEKVNARLSPESRAVDQAIKELGGGATKAEILDRANELVGFEEMMEAYAVRRGRPWLDYIDVKAILLENAFARRSQKKITPNGGLRELESYVIDASTGQRMFKFINEMSADEIHASEYANSDVAVTQRRRALIKYELRLRVEAREKELGRQMTPNEVQSVIDSESFVQWMDEVMAMESQMVDDHWHVIAS